MEKRPETDYLAILDTKATGSVASRTTIVKPENFVGTNGKGSYNLHGIGVHVEDDDNLRIFLINHRPQPNPHSNGANSTIELFESKLGSDNMQHVRTYADEVILTPNDLTPIGPDSFIFSNDHSVKVGQLKKLDIFAARSSVGRCDKNGCRKVIEKYLYPNGIAGVSAILILEKERSSYFVYGMFCLLHRELNFLTQTPIWSISVALPRIS